MSIDLLNKKWDVYRHISPSGKVYIGISTNVKARWENSGAHYCGYNSIFKNAIKKYGWNAFDHEILLNGVTKSEAIYAEKYLIKWYKSHGLSYNITDGGEGHLGFSPSAETRNKMSINNKGKHSNNEKAVAASRLAMSRMSEAERKEKYGHSSKPGRKHSLETIQKMSAAAQGRDMTKAIIARQKKHRLNSIPVVVSKNGHFVGEYQLLADACADLLLDQSNASRAIKKGICCCGYTINYKTL